MKICYFTIVTRNYVPYADALYKSLEIHESYFDFYCFIVDGVHGEDDDLIKNSDFNILFPSDIQINNYENLSIYYDAFELCNAMKAFIMRYILFEYNYDVGIYLDSDMLVFGSLHPVVDRMGDSSFGFSPHYLSPLPVDGELPNELTFMQSGIYNGGFWIFKRTDPAFNILGWLCDNCQKYAFNDQENGMFVDQKLISSAICIFNKYFYNINDVGCNVAYWNLHERFITFDKGFYIINGSQKLLLFHFSGYNINNILLSKHTTRRPLCIDTSEVLLSIFNIYSDLVLNSKLYFFCNKPYRFNFAGNVKLDKISRKIYFCKGNFDNLIIKKILYYVAILMNRISRKILNLIYA